MRGRRLGRTIIRVGRRASRVVVPGIAATFGTLAVSAPSHAQSAPPVTNCVPEAGGGTPFAVAPSQANDCIGAGGSTPSGAAPLTVPTGTIGIPAFDGSQFFSFKIPSDTSSLEVDVGLSGSDPELNAFLLLTVGGQLGRQVIVPLITVQPDITAGAATITGGSGGAATLVGGGTGAATFSGSRGSFTLPGGNDLSFGSFLIDQALGNLTVLGAGNSTVATGGQAATFSSVGGNSTFSAGGGAQTIGSVGGFFTLGGNFSFFVSGNNTIGGSNTIGGGTFLGGDAPADDVIVGIDLEGSEASLNGGIISFSATVDAPTVPEPGTLGLLASALAGFGWLRRRRS